MNTKENWCIKEEDWLDIKAGTSPYGDLLDMVDAGELVLITDATGSIIATLGIDENGKLKDVEL